MRERRHVADCLTEIDIENLIVGALDSDTASRFAVHMRACADCRAAVSTYRMENPTEVDRTHSTPGVGPTKGGLKLTISPTPPRDIPGYDILSKLHEGGQGVVYKALQCSTGRTVAIKVLRRGQGASTEQRKRFEREVKLAAGLRHQNIVTVYESGSTASGDYFAMEYVHGLPLDEYVFSKSIPCEAVLRMFVKIADAVSHAHRNGVIHRDLKPGNIVVDAGGEPFVLDFGLAKSAVTEIAGDAPLTATSQFMGTLAYASPEQTQGDPRRVDIRSDVYALGVMLYQLLTGDYPYPVSSDLVKTFHNINETAPIPPSRIDPALKGDIETILLTALSKEPDRRYQSAGEMARDIERYLACETISARRDSAAYVIRKRSQTLVQKHRWAASFWVGLATVLVAQSLGVAFVFHWTGINRGFEQFAAVVAKAGPDDVLDHVRFVLITDDTPINDVAATEGVEGVSKDNLKSWRRLHGQLMKKLVDARPRVVAFDITFSTPSEYDADFVSGVQSLRDVGIDVVTAVLDWGLDPDGRPALSKHIADNVRRGSASSSFNSGGQWRAQLAAQRPGRDVMSSFNFETCAAYEHPGLSTTVQMYEEEDKVSVSFWTLDSEMEGVRRYVGQPHMFDVTRVFDLEKDDPKAKLRKGDRLAVHRFDLPNDATMESSMVDYGDMFSMTPAALRGTFGGKIVMIADSHDGADMCEHDARGRLPCAWGHVAVLENLLAGTSAALPGPRTTYLWTIFASVVGLGVGAKSRGRVRVVFLSTVVVVLAAVVMSAAAFRYWHLLFNPSVPLIGFFLAMWAARVVEKMRVRTY